MGCLADALRGQIPPSSPNFLHTVPSHKKSAISQCLTGRLRHWVVWGRIRVIPSTQSPVTKSLVSLTGRLRHGVVWLRPSGDKFPPPRLILSTQSAVRLRSPSRWLRRRGRMVFTLTPDPLGSRWGLLRSKQSVRSECQQRSGTKV